MYAMSIAFITMLIFIYSLSVMKTKVLRLLLTFLMAEEQNTMAYSLRHSWHIQVRLLHLKVGVGRTNSSGS